MLLAEFEEIGVLALDIKKTVEGFDNSFRINQWHDKYALVQMSAKGKVVSNISISESQATQLIERLDLIEVNSHTFSNASSWHLRSEVMS